MKKSLPGRDATILATLSMFPCLLEFWSRIAGKDPFNRHVVVHLLVDEDPKCVCEGDVGRGWKPNKPKKSKNIKRKNK